MTIVSHPRRIAAGLTGAFLVAGALVAGAAPAAAAPAQTAAQTVAGTWSADVTIRTRTGTIQGRSTLVFVPGGRFCVTTATSRGTGSWRQSGPAFVYVGTEKQNDPALGSVKLNQAGKQSGNSFTSQGLSIVLDASGRPTGTAQSTVRATRTSTSTSGC